MEGKTFPVAFSPAEECKTLHLVDTSIQFNGLRRSVAEEFTRLLPQFTWVLWFSLSLWDKVPRSWSTWDCIFAQIEESNLPLPFLLPPFWPITRHCPCMWSLVWKSLLASFFGGKKSNSDSHQFLPEKLSKAGPVFSFSLCPFRLYG